MAPRKGIDDDTKRKPKAPRKSRSASRVKNSTALEVREPSRKALPALMDFPIVGIGASAGGLEAFEQFFNNMPPDSGMAFVIVQHLDPTHKSILTDLLKSYTRMQVMEVKDGVKVEPNTVYVIPPNSDMAILNGLLHLMEPTAPRGLRQPIDFFFRSLSEDRKEKAICIVFSGTGTEGTLGLREIKGQGGMVMVQDPDTAKYDGMPRSAIATGLVDYVLAPEKMPEQLLAYIKHPFTREAEKAPEEEPSATNLLQKILILVRSRTGNDFSQYKHSTIIRRIERRIAVHEIANMSDYLRYLQKYPEELDTLFKELVIGVTNFFRDREAFECLKKKVIPSLFEDKTSDSSVLRVWVPGCSTGEEAYSLGILLQEHMEQTKREIKVQIFATDIDNSAIETARAGTYPHGIGVDVRPERLRRFFNKHDNAYQVKKSIRDMIVFAVQNVITDPPFSKLDLISCRNLLIYMGSELQKRLLPIFHYSLHKNGFMFLGTSETVGEFSDLFEPVDRKWKIFRRRETEAPGAIALELTPAALGANVPAIADIRGPKPLERFSNQELAKRALLTTYSASGVLVNEKGDILYFHGSTAKYLQPPVGDANFNALGMAREGLKLELANALRKAMTTKELARYDRVRVKYDHEEILINLVVSPIWEPPSKRGLFMIVFEEVRPEEQTAAMEAKVDAGEQKGLAKRCGELQHELASTREYLQTTVEELETSNEELKSTNEELQSSNEELQSTNEELETAKEEQQSVNEELVTVNSELQQKIDALSKSNDDMNNLLAAIQIGTIFLDTDLNIQRFTPTVRKIINVIDSDIGRPLAHIVHNLDYGDFVQDMQDVLRTLRSKEKEVRTRTGEWYQMRALPYRTTQNVIEGVVVTYEDVTDRKRAEMAFQESERRWRTIGDLLSAVWTCDPAGQLTYMTESFMDRMGISWHDYEGHGWIEMMGLKDSESLLADWRRCTESGSSWHHTFSIRDRSGNDRTIMAKTGPVKNDSGAIRFWVGICIDLTEVSDLVGSCLASEP